MLKLTRVTIQVICLLTTIPGVAMGSKFSILCAGIIFGLIIDGLLMDSADYYFEKERKKIDTEFLALLEEIDRELREQLVLAQARKASAEQQNDSKVNQLDDE